MAWKDDLKKIVDSLTPGGFMAGMINSSIRQLTDLIISGSGQAIGAFNNLVRFFGAGQRLAKLLLIQALLTEDRERIKRTVHFLNSNNFLPARDIVGVIVNDVTDDGAALFFFNILVGDNGWRADTMLQGINQLPGKDRGIRLLVQVNPPSGYENWYQDLLRHGRPYSELFGFLVKHLHEVKQIAYETLLRLALEVDTHTAVELLRRMRQNGWSGYDRLVKIIGEGYPHLFYNLLTVLLQEGMIAWNKVKDLLRMPLLWYGADERRREGFFTLLLKTLTGLAKENNRLDAFFRQVAEWLAETKDRLHRLPREHGAQDRLSDHRVFDIPLTVWLTGKALVTTLGNNAVKAVEGLPVTKALVNAILPLEGYRDAILVAFMRVPGVFVLLLPALIAAAALIPMNFISWIGQDINNIVEQPGNRKLELANLSAPGTATNGQPPTRYMIFSDMHRDLATDKVHPVFWDTTHFSKNKEVYKTALTYCLENNYTVIENGDCEEFWFHPRITDNINERADKFYSDHKEIYDLLLRLYKDGNGRRYFRTRGNHDNWWNLRMNGMAELKKIFGDDFTVYDAFIIPKVKTMNDGILGQLWNLLANLDDPGRLQQLVDLFPFGLSPERYRENQPLFGLHGHQVDFWNCDEHYFLGYVIANAVGVPADASDSLPYYLRGIDMSGNPILRFPDQLVYRTPWNNWMPEHHARKMAREIEFMEEKERKLQDSVTFSETLAASLTLLLRADSPVPAIPGPQLQVVTGHTHNPQSRPYLKLPGGLASSLADRLKLLEWIKVPYFNCGTGSWLEGIVWAIEITPKSQPRLVYWDKNSKSPQVMGWELHDEPVLKPEEARQAIDYLFHLLRQAGVPGLHNAFGAGVVPSKPLPALKDLPDQFHYDFSALTDAADRVEQFHSAAASLLLQTLKKVLPNGGTTPLHITLDIPRLPVFDAKTGELPLVNVPVTGSKEAIVEKWMDYLNGQWGNNGVNSGTPVSIDGGKIRELVGIFFYLSYLFRSSVLNTLGLLLLIAAERIGRCSIRYVKSSHQLEIKI